MVKRGPNGERWEMVPKGGVGCNLSEKCHKKTPRDWRDWCCGGKPWPDYCLLPDWTDPAPEPGAEVYVKVKLEEWDRLHTELSQVQEQARTNDERWKVYVYELRAELAQARAELDELKRSVKIKALKKFSDLAANIKDEPCPLTDEQMMECMDIGSPSPSDDDSLEFILRREADPSVIERAKEANAKESTPTDDAACDLACPVKPMHRRPPCRTCDKTIHPECTVYLEYFGDETPIAPEIVRAYEYVKAIAEGKKILVRELNCDDAKRILGWDAPTQSPSPAEGKLLPEVKAEGLPTWLGGPRAKYVVTGNHDDLTRSQAECAARIINWARNLSDDHGYMVSAARIRRIMEGKE